MVGALSAATRAKSCSFEPKRRTTVRTVTPACAATSFQQHLVVEAFSEEVVCDGEDALAVGLGSLTGRAQFNVIIQRIEMYS